MNTKFHLNEILFNHFNFFNNTMSTQEVVDILEKRLKQNKIIANKNTYLGTGSYGKVFRINDKYTLKITDDITEASSASILKNKPSKLFVKIKDVFIIKELDYVFIIQEYLEKPDILWKNFVKDYIGGGYMITIENINKKFSEKGIDKKKYQQQIRWTNNVAKYLNKNRISFYDLHNKNIMKRKNNKHVVIDVGECHCDEQKIDIL